MKGNTVYRYRVTYRRDIHSMKDHMWFEFDDEADAQADAIKLAELPSVACVKLVTIRYRMVPESHDEEKWRWVSFNHEPREEEAIDDGE